MDQVLLMLISAAQRPQFHVQEFYPCECPQRPGDERDKAMFVSPSHFWNLQVLDECFWALETPYQIWLNLVGLELWSGYPQGFGSALPHSAPSN